MKMQWSYFRDPWPYFGPLVKKFTIGNGIGLGSHSAANRVSRVSRTGAGIRWPE
jgi:hypothetical protein